MDSISVSLIAGFITVIAFIYQYVKDRYTQGRDMGRLETRVAALENDKQVLETLTQTLTETRIAVGRLEQKVDLFMSRQDGN